MSFAPQPDARVCCSQNSLLRADFQWVITLFLP